MKLAVLLAGHVHPWEELLSLVRQADDAGYDAAYVDGDLCMLSQRTEEPVLDGWTVTTALLAHTRRIAVGSLRLVHYWNAARLAQMTATAAQLFPNRTRFFIAIGDRPGDHRFGLPVLPPRERVRWLDETLAAMRALWSGETVTRRGRHVRLEEARVRPTPPGGRLPIAIAARRPGMLEVVAEHADGWDVNLPPLPHRVKEASALLEQACRKRGRDPDEISRSMLIYTRIDDEVDPEASLRDYRRLNPWFHWIPDEEAREALVVGDADHCRARLAALTHDLRLAEPVLDLTGLDAPACRRVIEAMSPANNPVDTGT